MLYSVIKDRSYDSNVVRMGVDTVNAKLDEIAAANAGVSSKKVAVEKVLLDTFRQMTAIQVKWFVRLILKVTQQYSSGMI